MAKIFSSVEVAHPTLVKATTNCPIDFGRTATNLVDGIVEVRVAGLVYRTTRVRKLDETRAMQGPPYVWEITITPALPAGTSSSEEIIVVIETKKPRTVPLANRAEANANLLAPNKKGVKKKAAKTKASKKKAAKKKAATKKATKRRR